MIFGENVVDNTVDNTFVKTNWLDLPKERFGEGGLTAIIVSLALLFAVLIGELGYEMRVADPALPTHLLLVGGGMFFGIMVGVGIEALRRWKRRAYWKGYGEGRISGEQLVRDEFYTLYAIPLRTADNVAPIGYIADGYQWMIDNRQNEADYEEKHVVRERRENVVG